MKQNESDFNIAKQNKNEKHRLPERIGSLLDIPADLLCGGCYAEMRGQNELMIQGCRKIAVYTEEEIFLLLRRGGIRVRGRRLTCISYHAGKIEIRGWITGIDFRNTEGTL